MIDLQLQAEVSDIVYREARLIDEQRWEEWIALYCEDAVFWVPAFRMDGSYTEDPKTELNMIYIDNRAGLEARIFRVNTEIALSSTPVPRTTHVVGGVLIDGDDGREVKAYASWQVVWTNDVRGQQVRAGSYAYRLRRADKGLAIAEKKILILDSTIDGYFDVYAI